MSFVREKDVPSEDKKMEDKKERKKGPLSKLFYNPISKAIDGAFVGLLKVVEQVGLDRQIRYPHYLNQDWFWWNVMKNIWDFEIIGYEHIPPEGQGAVLCSNHSSYWDPLVVGVALCHYTRRRIHEMGKVELFKMPLVNAYLRWIYGFPVRRGESDKEAFEYAIKRLKEGEIVGMFPEGTLNNGEDRFLTPKTGAVYLAISANVPILPMAVSGSDRILGKGVKVPKLNSKLVCKFGELIPIHEKYNGNKVPSKEVLLEESDRVMLEIKKLLVYDD
ncbi:MAG: lysophospholipid acyltransferase family protein [Promethearchaeota archaeon]